jgi:hypothetical protein
MTRMIWMVRFFALAVLLILTILMMNLYTKLRRMSAEQPAPGVTAPRTPQQ